MSVPMDKLDDAIIAHIEERFLEPQRLEKLVEQLLDRRQEWADQRRGHVGNSRDVAEFSVLSRSGARGDSNRYSNVWTYRE